jgi:capsid protein
MTGRASAETEPGWIEPSWPEIDRLKEANADIVLLKAGLKSRKEIIEARGREFETVRAEIAADPIPQSTGAAK